MARRWAARLGDTNGVSLPADELESVLLEVAREAHASADHAGAAARERFTALYANSPVGIALADPSGRVAEANAALGQLLGCPPEALRGTEIPSLGAGERNMTQLRTGLADLHGNEVSLYHSRLLLEHADDGPMWVHVTLARLPGDGPGPGYPMLIVEDANELHLLQETLRHQNLHDPLTGLPNASQFSAKLETSMSSGADTQIALVYLDIDGFKVINDGLGAGVGDQVLREIAGKLQALFTTHDAFVARLSGDGFAIVMVGELTPAEVVDLVEQALADLAEPVYLDEFGIGVSASVGIVVRDAAEGTPADLLRAAELALHRAKEAGKAQWMLFDPALDARDRSRYQLGAVIAGALENGEFSLIYQPTVKLADQKQLAVVNAGLRWNHPHLGELDSDEFYPLAETTGMTIPLGRWLLTEALAATARWRADFGEAGPELCVRLPARLATDPDLVLLVREELERNELPPRALRLCVDGRSLFDANGELIDSLAVLAELGVQLVLTVHGTADLELIPHRELPVGHVILSGPVVDAIGGDDPASAAAWHLDLLVERAKQLRLRIGAEGVRDQDQAARLREHGIMAARGPFIAETATSADIDALIARHAS
ncbi:GGDEF domain-containing protein [Amycolatopsis antarctica]|uniref:GGDEF domain-containing protein n=1 Tax=Amycolatopsis antarctica TaxID=1854586 RepID=A0A263D4F2_9PSEU|nr:EAL domain-containing protein [Amycolatopsis antarctica]OZM72497.1 GGDEF domain-containing protein [Amycolatopsis antarctica]